MGEDTICIGKKLRFAVLGTGFWSTLQIPAWFEVGGVELVALYNRTVSKAEALACKYGVPRVYDDPEKLFQNEELDFVDIITEVPAHAHLVLLAAKYKVPVICQKPMAPDYETCVEMVNACKANGTKFFIHENYRWQPQFRFFKSVLDSSPIGRIRRIEFNHPNRGRTTFANQPFLKTLPHFIITDGGSHFFDLMRYYFGEPKSVYCHALKTYEELAGEDSMAVILRYDDKICTCTVSENIIPYIYIDGENGTLEMLEDDTVRITTPDKVELLSPPESPRYDWAKDIYSYLPPSCIHNIVDCNRSFYQAFINGADPETSSEDNLKTMKIVYGACRSTEKNEVVML